MDLIDRSVLVTGGASGIGRALAERFHAEGARVGIADLDGDGVRAVGDGLGIPAYETDVSVEAEVEDMLGRARADLGPVDLFCSNAGVASFGGPEAADDVWRQSLDVNVLAHVYATRVLIPEWTERGGGYLLVTASAAGLLTQLGSAPYAVTKHAAVAFAEWVAITYGDRGVRASVLCPQGVRTGMTAPLTDTEGNVIAVDGMLEPEEVADTVVAGLADERFLILPHPEVGEYFRRKADDYDRWLGGMRRLQQRLSGAS